MSFHDLLKVEANAIQSRLRDALKVFPKDRITDGMAHALNGGKRLRGFFVLQSAGLYNVPKDHAISAAAAIEALHAYSLVHDDLPAMDDDDLRRGQPTVHVKWDEATAILVGDALQALAFELVTMGPLGPAQKLTLSQLLAQQAGGRALIRGQNMDIEAETTKTPLSLSDIEILQSGKTGALIEWSCMAGAIMADANPAPMQHYASCLGRAFQIADDLLDVTGDEAKTGKRLQKDNSAGKATFVSHLGQYGAKTRARELVAEALHALTPYNAEADTLRDAARFVISREF